MEITLAEEPFKKLIAEKIKRVVEFIGARLAACPDGSFDLDEHHGRDRLFSEFCDMEEVLQKCLDERIYLNLL